MVKRVSALRGHYTPGKIGMPGRCGVAISEVRDLELHQVAAWPQTLDEVGAVAANAVGVDAAPAPCRSATGPRGSLLRIEPLKWWLLAPTAPDLAPDQGATLDLSHSRTWLRVTGEQGTELLQRLLPLDFRSGTMPQGTVASSAIHHVGVTLWHSADGYELFIPRGFALSIWELVQETALQFGAEID